MDNAKIMELRYLLTGLSVHIAEQGHIINELLYEDGRMRTMVLDEGALNLLEEMIKKYRQTLKEYNEAESKRAETITKPKGDKYGRFVLDE